MLAQIIFKQIIKWKLILVEEFSTIKTFFLFSIFLLLLRPISIAN